MAKIKSTLEVFWDPLINKFLRTKKKHVEDVVNFCGIQMGKIKVTFPHLFYGFFFVSPDFPKKIKGSSSRSSCGIRYSRSGGVVLGVSDDISGFHPIFFELLSRRKLIQNLQKCMLKRCLQKFPLELAIEAWHKMYPESAPFLKFLSLPLIRNWFLSQIAISTWCHVFVPPQNPDFFHEPQLLSKINSSREKVEVVSYVTNLCLGVSRLQHTKGSIKKTCATKAEKIIPWLKSSLSATKKLYPISYCWLIQCWIPVSWIRTSLPKKKMVAKSNIYLFIYIYIEMNLFTTLSLTAGRWT